MSNLLFIHDNHVIFDGFDFLFRNSTFHLFLKGFSQSAHLLSPVIGSTSFPSLLHIDDVAIRTRRGYGRAHNFYRFFPIHAFRSFFDIYKVIQEYESIIIVGPSCSAPFAHLAAWLQRKPILGYIIGDSREVVASSKDYVGFWKWVAKMVARWEWSAMQRLAKRHQVIALGEHLAESLTHYGDNVSLGFTSLIKEKQIVSEKCFHESGTLELLTVCRISQEKGIEWALRAIALLKQLGILINYTVVGDGPDLKRLLLLVDELGVGSEVRFVGAKPYSEIVNYYQVADIFILPSYTEGVAKVLLEAMANRLPIVATKVGGTPWLLGHGDRGTLVEFGNHHAIAEAVLKFQDDHDFRLRSLSNATNFIMQNTIEASANFILNTVAIEMGISR